MSATEQYIRKLQELKSGDLGLLRSHLGQGLDHTVQGFDLFTGLWWPLRQQSQQAPRRQVAWLVAKLYAFRPVPDVRGSTLACQLSKCWHRLEKKEEKERFQDKFDNLLTLPVRRIEPALQWALDEIDSWDLGLDWARLTDDLSFWDDTKRLQWAEEFLNIKGGEQSC